MFLLCIINSQFTNIKNLQLYIKGEFKRFAQHKQHMFFKQSQVFRLHKLFTPYLKKQQCININSRLNENMRTKKLNSNPLDMSCIKFYISDQKKVDKLSVQSPKIKQVEQYNQLEEIIQTKIKVKRNSNLKQPILNEKSPVKQQKNISKKVKSQKIIIQTKKQGKQDISDQRQIKNNIKNNSNQVRQKRQNKQVKKQAEPQKKHIMTKSRQNKHQIRTRKISGFYQKLNQDDEKVTEKDKIKAEKKLSFYERLVYVQEKQMQQSRINQNLNTKDVRNGQKLLRMLQNVQKKYAPKTQQKQVESKLNKKKGTSKKNRVIKKQLQSNQTFLQQSTSLFEQSRQFQPYLSQAKATKLSDIKQFCEHSNKDKLVTLNNILAQANLQLAAPQIKQFQENLFYVLDPQSKRQPLISFGFRYYLFRFCKYQIYFKQQFSTEDILDLELKIIQVVKFYCLDKRNNQINKDTLKLPDQKLVYMKHFLQNLLPFENRDLFTDVFLEVGIQYFTQLKNMLKQKNKLAQLQMPSVNILSMIQQNLARILFKEQTQIQDDQALEDDYLLHRTFFSLYLDFFCLKKEQFQTAQRIQCVIIAKFLKVAHPEFVQLIKQTVQTNKQNYSTSEFLVILGYLVQSKNTPYQYFYRHKGDWMDIIQATHDFSAKKTKCCIKFLEVFSRERFVHCQQIYHKLLTNIQNNLQAMDGKQLVRTLYYYSRARYGVNPRFVANMVSKIYNWLPFLQEKQFSLLVRSIGNLNYQSPQLVEKLKNINYQRFLGELKFGCQNLGSYYKEILKQVQLQSQGRVLLQGEQAVEVQNQTQKQENYREKVI